MIYKRFPFFFLPLFFHLLHPYPHLRSAASVVALVKPFTTSWYVYNVYMSLCVYVRSFTHSFSHLFNIFQQADEKLFNYWLFPESINRSNRCLYCYTECCSFECNKFHFTKWRNEKKINKKWLIAVTAVADSEWDFGDEEHREREKETQKIEKLAYKIIKTHVSFDRQNLCRSAHNTRFTI